MWISQEHAVISERPDEEEENSDSDSNTANRLTNQNLGGKKSTNPEVTKIGKILDIHRKENDKFAVNLFENFTNSRKRSVLNTSENMKKHINSKSAKGRLNKGGISNSFEDNLRCLREREQNLRPAICEVKNNNTVHPPMIPYQFLNLESISKQTDEFDEVLVKMEDSKTIQKNTNYQNTFHIKKEKFNYNYNPNIAMSAAEKEELEKFNSLKSVTNTEKIRQYIRYKEAWNYFSSNDLSEEKSQIIVEDFSKYNCFKKIYLSCSKKLLLDFELIDEREQVFAIAKVGLSYNDEFHIRIITTIYKTLTSELECPVTGDHWMKIGFQSSEPKIDLRSTGMFSMLLTLAFIDKFLFYAKEIYAYSLGGGSNLGSERKKINKEKEDYISNNSNNLNFNSSESNNSYFPFICVMINLASFTLEALRQGYLIPFCNSSKSIINTLCDYFFGIIDHFFTVYKNSPTELDNINTLLTQVDNYAKNNPERILLLVRHLVKKYPQTLKDSMSLGEEIYT